MRRSSLRGTFLLGGFLAFALGFAPAQGAFIATETSSVTTLTTATGNLYLYSYLVSVAGNSTVSASEFDVSLGAPIIASSIVMPTNFLSFYTDGDPFITFTAFDNGTPFVGISPGSSGTFSFFSIYGPAAGSYQVLGLDSSSFTTATVTGGAIIPGAVPEPASVALLGLGVCGALGGYARSRRRAAISIA